MAIGMAMGTKFYLLGIIATVVISIVIVIMNRFDWFARKNLNQVLSIQLDPTVDFDHIFDSIFLSYTKNADLISVDSIRSGMVTELVYNVTLKDGINKQQLLQEIKKLNNNQKVSLVT